MTVLFDIRGATWPVDEDGCALPPAAMHLNIANTNARDFLDWIGLCGAELTGEIPARELAAILRRRLWPERQCRSDAGVCPQVQSSRARATALDFGRPAGRLAEYAQRLLRLAEHAADGIIVWN